MAATIVQTGQKLTAGAAGVLFYFPATDEAQAVTASKNGGNYAAVNAGTVAAIVGGTNAEALWKITVNAADTATPGPIAFKCIGATSTTVVIAEVVALAYTGVDLSAAQPRYRVRRNQAYTLQWYQLGTLPSKASISVDGGTFADSTNAPATVNAGFRKLVLTAAELANRGTLHIDVTTTSTGACTVGLLVEVVDFDPAVAGLSDRARGMKAVQPA